MTTPHRLNSDFQLRHFIAGAKHTPDAAWCALYNQLVDIDEKVGCIAAQINRREAKRQLAKAVLETYSPEDGSPMEAHHLEAQADLFELAASQRAFDLNCEAAKKEKETIEKLMAELEPYCKYGHLPILERGEAVQREEWALELSCRIENSMLSIGSISPDLLSAARQHPDFTGAILPTIARCLNLDMTRADSAQRALSAPQSSALLLLK